jgi:sterol desaturase/sphingolipid hydroxylase (fatty acid hydroxylase superfamily)
MTTLSQIAHPMTSRIVLIFAIGFMVLEYGISRLARQDTHDLRESAASFGIAVGQSLIRVLEAGLIAIPFAFAYAHRLFEFDSRTVAALTVLFFATEFVYYWHHRATHRIRWLWATHAVHQSPTRLNFTAAIRLGWTGNLSGNFLFFLPLVWIGFEPITVIGMLGANLLYQFFIHTEFVPTLGPIEWIFNTPAQHRVHHSSNAACIDRNYGGVLSIFDRLFGTFATAPLDEPLRYGLVGCAPTLNPIRIAFGEWAVMVTELRQAIRWSARWNILFGPPRSERRLDTNDAPPACRPAATNQPIHIGVPS